MSSNDHVAGRFWIIIGLLLIMIALLSISGPSKSEGLDVTLRGMLGWQNKYRIYQKNDLYLCELFKLNDGFLSRFHTKIS